MRGRNLTDARFDPRGKDEHCYDRPRKPIAQALLRYVWLPPRYRRASARLWPGIENKPYPRMSSITEGEQRMATYFDGASVHSFVPFTLRRHAGREIVRARPAYGHFRDANLVLLPMDGERRRHDAASKWRSDRYPRNKATAYLGQQRRA